MSDIFRRLDELEPLVASLQANLTKAVSRTRGTVGRAISRLVGRYGRALLEANGVAAARIERLQTALFPEGVPQERFYSLPYFACRYGSGEFKGKVLAALDPFAAQIRELQL